MTTADDHPQSLAEPQSTIRLFQVDAEVSVILGDSPAPEAETAPSTGEATA